FIASTPNRHLHSFPTRRSSDLAGDRGAAGGRGAGELPAGECGRRGASDGRAADRADGLDALIVRLGVRTRHFLELVADAFQALRSEEHTSELQSRSDLVCRLLL